MIAWDFLFSHEGGYTEYDYAHLFCQESMEDACPAQFERPFIKLFDMIKAYKRSYEVAGIDMGQVDLREAIPLALLDEYVALREQICQYIVENTARPLNYDFLRELRRLVYYISRQPLNIDHGAVYKIMNPAMQQLIGRSKYVRYNIFGSTTGRLTTTRQSFPILSLPREFRHVIQPQNDLLVELDFKSAELRLFLRLLGDGKSGIEDLHAWNAENIFKSTKDEAKIAFFKWLFSDRYDKDIEKFYCKDTLLGRYTVGEAVLTPFSRRIKTDRFHSLSYLIQSTSSDMVQEQTIKVFNFLRSKKSVLAFTVHDSMVVDYSLGDGCLQELREIFENTRFGLFPTTVALGNDYGHMVKK